MIDIVALAERYTEGKRGSTRKAAYEAFIAGAKALSVATRTEWEAGVDYAPGSRLDNRRTQGRESMRKHRAKRKLPEGHKWFTA